MAIIKVQNAPVTRRSIDEVVGETLPGFTNGSSATGSTYWRRLLNCPREHYLGNIVQLKTPGLREALDIGTLFHLALQVYYEALHHNQTHQNEGGLAPDVEAFDAVKAFSEEPGYKDTYVILERTLDAYFTKYEKDIERLEVVAVEASLENDAARDGFPWTTRLDLVVIDHSVRGGGLFIYEHKCIASIGADAIKGYNQDLQTLGQIWLAQHELDLESYPPFLGTIVNLMSKTKEPQGLRFLVQPSPKTLDEWADSMRKFWAMSQLYPSLGYPQNYSQCTRKFGACSYYNVCQMHAGASLQELAALNIYEEAPRE